MKNTVTESDFIQAFKDHNRFNAWTPEGLATLYRYLTEIEEECENDIELDVVAFDCEYREGTTEDILADYDYIDSLEELEEHTTVIMVDSDREDPESRIIIAEF